MPRYIYPFKAGTRVTQNYGMFPGGYNPRGGHTGKDYGVNIGTPIYAACDSIVAFEGWTTGEYYQNPWWFVAGTIAVVLDETGPAKASFTYGHMDSTIVNKGDRVKQGQIIGYSGNTGQSSGPHCHFEYLPNNWDYQNGTFGRLNPDAVCEYWDGSVIIPQGGVTKPATPDEDPTHWAIDISNHQGDINISAVNPDRVIIRTSEGVGGSDAWLEASVRKARNAGKFVDFYHFSHIGQLDGNTPRAEADYFLSQVRRFWKPGDHVVLDWEERYSQLWNGQAAKEWMDRVLATLKAPADAAVFYSNLSILTTHHAGLKPYRDKYPQLWLAYYGDESMTTWGDPAVVYGTPDIPAGWVLWGWQFTQYGRVPGYTGNLDLNIIYGGDTMPTPEEVAHALLVKPIGDAYNGENGKPKVTVSDLLVKLWQDDMEGIDFKRPAGNGFLIREDIAALTETVKAIPAGKVEVIPAPAPVLADTYEVILKKVDETP